MSPTVRKLSLTLHVTASLGWMGAVLVFLALALVGLTSTQSELVRASYIAMDLSAWNVIIPLSLASLFTGIVQSLGTPWGLIRHYWVLFKLLITVVATAVLLLQIAPIGFVASEAAATTLASSDLREARISLIVHAAGGMAVLLVATGLSVFKPRGLTPFGQRKPLT